LQAAFTREADYPRLAVGIRGERALIHRILQAIEKGEYNPEGTSRFLSVLQAWAMRTVLYQDWAKLLQVLTDSLAITKLPIEEQAAAMKPIDQRFKGGGVTNIFIRLLMPAQVKVTDASLRTQGVLHSGAVAIACERFARINKRWPNTLDEIPKSILAKIPSDPFTGKPLIYKRLPDGIMVYTVGPDGIDNGGDLTGTTGMNSARPTDFGVRLYDLNKRGLPALPKTPDAETP
jgi:hypothetical protein